MPDITVESVRAEEGDSFTFIVTLSEAAPAAVTVDYQTYLRRRQRHAHLPRGRDQQDAARLRPERHAL
jgi:hypothetical protein